MSRPITTEDIRKLLITCFQYPYFIGKRLQELTDDEVWRAFTEVIWDLHREQIRRNDEVPK